MQLKKYAIRNSFAGPKRYFQATIRNFTSIIRNSHKILEKQLKASSNPKTYILTTTLKDSLK